MTPKDETILETDNVRVRVMTLEIGGVTPKHYHTQVSDYIVCLKGQIEIRLQAPDEHYDLNPGERISISPGRVHTVINLGEEKAEYLLIQGIGKYDFKKL